MRDKKKTFVIPLSRKLFGKKSGQKDKKINFDRTNKKKKTL